MLIRYLCVVCDTAKVRFFKQITTYSTIQLYRAWLFAILQKYDFSSKSQLLSRPTTTTHCCLRYCKSTIFQANHNNLLNEKLRHRVVCDTAKVRFFKQITTPLSYWTIARKLFAILQKYDFSSKSQQHTMFLLSILSCLRYCKSTIFQANHNFQFNIIINLKLVAILQKYDLSSTSQQLAKREISASVVCDTAKVRFFKQITTPCPAARSILCCLRYCKSTIFQANHNEYTQQEIRHGVVCDTAKVRFFKQITTELDSRGWQGGLFAILQKYDFSSKSQHKIAKLKSAVCCLRYCKSTIFQANHNCLSYCPR